MNNLIEALIENMEKVIVGKRSVLEHILVALLSDGHVLIEDVPVKKQNCHTSSVMEYLTGYNSLLI